MERMSRSKFQMTAMALRHPGVAELKLERANDQESPAKEGIGVWMPTVTVLVQIDRAGGCLSLGDEFYVDLVAIKGGE